ncbi:MAG: hypothetical protein JST77_14355, partial [Acidobacteria bacterium]|nr:hypothetical protein [Acidobacteriota bacterium]
GEGSGIAAERAARIAKEIAFRGPDGQMEWSHPGVHFWFSFLKTGPAPQTKSQPFSLDGKVWLLGDVRLDGRNELMERFVQRGEAIGRTSTDEELVLHAFQIFGEKGIADLDGDYSFVLWDAREKKLKGYRDATGAKPFFYCEERGELSFSNTLEAICAAQGSGGELDENYLADYLLTSWCLEEERTVYRKIRRLTPGHVLEFSGGKLQVKRLTQLPMEEPLIYKKEEEYIEHFRELFHLSVKDRLPGSGAVIFMSGGLDSTSVAAEAKRIAAGSGLTGKVSAQTTDYAPLFDDPEGEEARRVAEYLEIPIETQHAGNCEPFSDEVERDGFPLPEPKHEPYLALNVEGYKSAGKMARVALTGNGGDDILLGAAGPYLKKLVEQGKIMGAVWALLEHLYERKRLPNLGLGIRSRIRNRFGRGVESDPFPEWIRDDFGKRLNARARFEELRKKPSSKHPMHPTAYAMLTGPFWPDVLEGEDAAWSGTAMETRTPLLDRRMVRFLLRLPVMPWCMDKQLLRRAMKGALPEATLRRPKTPLAQDPVWLQVSQGKWKPGGRRKWSKRIEELVDTGRLENCIERSDANGLYANLRPFSLDQWVKSVEMKRGIQ